MAMLEADDFVKGLQGIGFDFFTGVPDTILGGIIAHLTDERLYIPAVREDEAVAMAAGAYFGGKIPVVLMQNSGLGNALNVLESLNLIYQIPCLLLVSWRGFEGKDAPEHLVMGETMAALLDTVRIPHRTLAVETIAEDLQWTAKTFMEQRIPVALLLKKGIVKTVQP
jgi:sulfopyruvate decarboxylase alpha subunit